MSPLHLPRGRRPRLEALECRLAPTAAPMAIESPSAQLAQLSTDPRFGEQWGLNNATTPAADVDAARAWDVTTGSTGVTVAVVDTGIDYTHQDVYLNVWVNQAEIPAAIRSRLTDVNADGRITFHDLADARNQGTGKITDLNGNGRIDGADLLRPTSQGGWADGTSNNGDRYVDDLVGWNFVANTNNPFDDHGHGTHASGIIGASGTNGVGGAGLNWTSQLMGLKVFTSTGSGSTAYLAAAVDYAATLGAKVINASWVLASPSTTLGSAIARAEAAGALVVAAAGNAGQNIDGTGTYPATSTAANVITVAAVDAAGRLGTYSNYGATAVDVAAPGSNILSTNPGGIYGHRTGTSMATPFVSGVAALVWAKYPSWTFSEVIAQIKSTVTRSDLLTGKVASGGIVNAGTAVGAAESLGTGNSTAPRIVNSAPNGPTATTLSSVRVTFDRAMTFSTLVAANCTLLRPDGQTATGLNVKEVAGSGGKSFDVVFSLQTLPGTYLFRVNGAKDAAGATMVAYATQITRGTPTATWPRIVSIAPNGPTATTLSSVRVTFDRAMTFSTLTTAGCSLLRPNGQPVTASNVKEVSGSGGKSFDVIFPLQTMQGTYVFRVSGAKDPAGAMMDPYSGEVTIGSPTTPPVEGPRVVDAVTNGPTAITMSSVRVTFDRAMNFSTLTMANCTVIRPDGQVVTATNVKEVSGSGGKSFDVIFPLQTQRGTYTFRIAAGATDLAGVPMQAYSLSFQR